jgi:hypothetical protein
MIEATGGTDALSRRRHEAPDLRDGERRLVVVDVMPASGRDDESG